MFRRADQASLPPPVELRSVWKPQRKPSASAAQSCCKMSTSSTRWRTLTASEFRSAWCTPRAPEPSATSRSRTTSQSTAAPRSSRRSERKPWVLRRLLKSELADNNPNLLFPPAYGSSFFDCGYVHFLLITLISSACLSHHQFPEQTIKL